MWAFLLFAAQIAGLPPALRATPLINAGGKTSGILSALTVGNAVPGVPAGAIAHLPRRACGTAHADHLDHCLVLLFYIVGIGGNGTEAVPYGFYWRFLKIEEDRRGGAPRSESKIH